MSGKQSGAFVCPGGRAAAIETTERSAINSGDGTCFFSKYVVECFVGSMFSCYVLYSCCTSSVPGSQAVSRVPLPVAGRPIIRLVAVFAQNGWYGCNKWCCKVWCQSCMW